ncbi:MAG: ATP-binding protein, partial [Rhodospirillales bacterium]
MTEHKKPTKEPFYISSINLIGLFGRYDYSLPNNKNKNKKSTLSELLILYGDNGTGKTTILNLIYRALLPTRTRNAKTYIAKTPFKSLEINFNDGSKVYYLKSDKLVGSFEATVKVKRGSPKTFKLEAADDGAIKSTAENFFEL